MAKNAHEETVEFRAPDEPDEGRQQKCEDVKRLRKLSRFAYLIHSAAYRFSPPRPPSEAATL